MALTFFCRFALALPSRLFQSVVSAIDKAHILAPDNAVGRSVVALAQADAKLGQIWADEGSDWLKVTFLPDKICANILRIGQNVVMQKGGWVLHWLRALEWTS
jgi:hypothetical protein